MKKDWWKMGLFVSSLFFMQVKKENRVHIDTDYGKIVVELYPDKAPKTVENFLWLVRRQFYTGLTFHRIVPGFVIQGGDNRGDGTGGPGYTLPAEIHPDLKHEEGVVAMARLPDEINPERRSSGSQFYITVAPAHRLDGKYTIFGKVVEGLNVAKNIVALPRGPRDKPLKDVVMTKVYIEGEERWIKSPQRCGPFTRSFFFKAETVEWWLLKDGKNYFLLSTGPALDQEIPVKKMSAIHFDLYCEPVREKGKNEPVVVEYTGGAHCCWTYRVYTEQEGKVLETLLDVGNGYEPRFEDLNGDGIKEILASDDRLDYFDDLSHAVSPFLPMVLCYSVGKFQDCSAQFPQVTRDWLNQELKKAQKETEKWNSEMRKGRALGIFAASVRMGEKEKGYQRIGKFCSAECLDWLKKYEVEIIEIATTPRPLYTENKKEQKPRYPLPAKD